MASSSGGLPVYAAVPPPPTSLTTPFATILNSNTKTTPHTTQTNFTVAIKNPKLLNGRHTISWHTKEIEQSIFQTKLQYAIMGKFKYGNPDINELRRVIPLQCEIKGEVTIGVLETRLILIRCTLKEDYVKLLSSSGFWLRMKNESILMRTLKWETWYDSKKETSTAVAWISFPNLPPNLFAREFVHSIALAVGNPLHVDMATKNNTRPSCARVKVEVDLLKDLPEGIEVGEHNDDETVIASKWINIRYDYLPKYCKTCYLQGHDEEGCYPLHPELFPKKDTSHKLDNPHGDLRNKLNDQKQKNADGNTISGVDGMASCHGNDGEEWKLVQRKKHVQKVSSPAHGSVTTKVHDKGVEDAPQENIEEVEQEVTEEEIQDEIAVTKNLLSPPVCENKNGNTHNPPAVLNVDALSVKKGNKGDSVDEAFGNKVSRKGHFHMDTNVCGLGTTQTVRENSNKQMLFGGPSQKSNEKENQKVDLTKRTHENGGDRAPALQHVPDVNELESQMENIASALGPCTSYAHDFSSGKGQRPTALTNVTEENELDGQMENKQSKERARGKGDIVVKQQLLNTRNGPTYGLHMKASTEGWVQNTSSNYGMVLNVEETRVSGNYFNLIATNKHWSTPVSADADVARKVSSQFEDSSEGEGEGEGEGEDEEEEEEYEEEDGDEEGEEDEDEEEEGEEDEEESDEENGESTTHKIDAPTSNIQPNNIPLLEPIRIQPPRTTRSIYKVVSRK